MNEEELYKLAISDVPKYSLLNEILAIRDNRFPNEEVDYCINVNGYISLDVLNKYVRNINELEQLQNNWNELKKWLEETIKQYDNVGLKFKKESNFECASRSYDYLKQYQTMLDKMQELEQGKDE